MQQYDVKVSEVALWSLQDIESFNAPRFGSEQVADFVDNLLLTSVKSIKEDPSRYRFNARLADKGVKLRERITSDGNYLILYDFDGKSVDILLFMSTKQDLEALLHRYMILK
ncbi:type II toxin-antitoxin system RelE/ParE family toxin [Shewanella morhuae]|uniref:type II toxin-antitoxin system RelE/ParE family toxin n=1 Tax=Shewanella morhuae TaxID=365591 RepID=UPI001BB8F4C9|nr:type II toxin-antitoxin system RelE/ParE family toxin [Shewanella morhuae]GIU13908.1 hypothetical protein TUM4641_33990 [Shewanella morhuae]